MIYTRSTTKCHIAKQQFTSSFAVFQTPIHALSHTLTLIHEPSWNRIKEKVHTQKMPCQIISLPSTTGNPSKDDVLETQPFPYIAEGCNHGLGQPATASLQSPWQHDKSSKDGPRQVSIKFSIQIHTCFHSRLPPHSAPAEPVLRCLCYCCYQ